MHWSKDDAHPFAGIAKKLERTDQNIVNLNDEIADFFKKSKYPVIPDTKNQEWQDAVNYHRSLPIPTRFSVLVGEIVHHFRSCLDHLVWHFSSEIARREKENVIEFPVFSKPLTKDQQARYERKVQGITNTNVLGLIDRLQPHHRLVDAINDPVCIIHDMDRFDKHRELVVVAACANIVFPAGTSIDVIRNAMAQRNGQVLSFADFAAVQDAVKNNAQVFPQVAFGQFGNRTDQFVVPSLIQLLNAVDGIIDLFAAEAGGAPFLTPA